MLWESLLEVLQKLGLVLLSGFQIHSGALAMKAMGWSCLATSITCVITSGVGISLLYWGPEEMTWSRGTKKRMGVAVKRFFIRALGQNLFDIITLETVEWDDRLIERMSAFKGSLLERTMVRKHGEWLCYLLAIFPFIPYTVQLAVIALRIKKVPPTRGYFTILTINSVRSVALVLAFYQGVPWLLKLFGA